ncbi:hypothetical protein ACLB2K_007441 [Fragaria x ananassa]
MLTLLISRPKQPGNDIDAYLQPLIDYLKLLWNGVEGVYDAYKWEYFKLKAVLFWTINDFPTYGNLSGSIVRGYNGCPICVDQTRPHRLKKGNKLVFIRHHRGLPRHHPYRRQAAIFDNIVEEDLAHVPLTGEEVLTKVESLNYEFGKREESTPHVRIFDDQDRPCWKKKSVFFQLEYWKDIPVQHNLDGMHIEKNYCDSIIENSKPEVFHASNPLAAPIMISVYGKEMEQAHMCILQNIEDVGGFFSEHMELLKLLHPRFAKDEKWLKDKQN